MDQHPNTLTDIFICQTRSLLADRPDHLSEKVKIYMVYGLLHRRIRKRVLRDKVETFQDLLKSASEVENALNESKCSRNKSILKTEETDNVVKRERPPHASIAGHT